MWMKRDGMPLRLIGCVLAFSVSTIIVTRLLVRLVFPKVEDWTLQLLLAVGFSVVYGTLVGLVWGLIASRRSRGRRLGRRS
jgi:hypothetical protein